MAKSLFWVSIVLGLALAACAPATLPSPIATPGPSPLASPLEPPTVPQGISIIYHRSGGFAGTDDTWKIAADGAVSHQGQTASAVERLTSTQMAELAEAVRAANFMSLEESYVPKDICCDRYLYEITVILAGQTKTVRTLDASPTAPVELNRLIDMLNQLVATSSPATK